MGETQPAGRQAAERREVTARPFRVASPAVAVALGALGLVLLAAWVPLTFLTRDLQVSRDGAAAAFVAACGLLGILVARRQPRNPEGWLLLGLAVAGIGLLDCGLYAVLDYHMHHGRLPLGETAVFIKGTIGPPLIFLFALVILLFPDGRLTRRWTWVLWAYLVLVVVVTAGFVANEAGTIAGRRIQVDVNGAYSGRAARPASSRRSRLSREPDSSLPRCSGPRSSPARSSAGGAPPATGASSSNGSPAAQSSPWPASR